MGNNEKCVHTIGQRREYVYHSCRNRHCPAFGNSKKEEWIEARLKELLPVKYYHAVFTMPHQLNSLVMGNRKAMFKLLFDAASYALLKFAKDEKYLGAQPGIIAVLHTCLSRAKHTGGSAVELSSTCALHSKRWWYR